MEEHKTLFYSKFPEVITKNTRIISKDELQSIQEYLKSLNTNAVIKISGVLKTKIKRNSFKLANFGRELDVVCTLSNIDASQKVKGVCLIMSVVFLFKGVYIPLQLVLIIQPQPYI